MAFDPNTRNKLAGMISQARQLLVKEFTEQLQQIYGIQPAGTIMEVEKLKHLDEQQTTTARLLRDRIDHLVSSIVDEKRPIVAAIERTIREQAFTVLNRFAALRMCEEREIIRECVRKVIQSQGFQVYLQVAGSSLGDTYQRYRVFLHCLFDELSIDLGMLFDRYSPFGLLFPREQALSELLKIINDPQLKDLWKEDETIGWVYQYFNTKEEREAMRKASQAPRNSRELAVRNQFFTPRYVVEFLTDNTLGRIWYEMTKGKTGLKDKCCYLVRRPNEVFLAEGMEAPVGSTDDDEGAEKSQEELLKEPVYIPYRPLKDPRMITMLDPACGSMHFGLYAFDLYETIYEEAWDNYPELLTDIREQVSSKDDFVKMVPEMIIRHNIHGIDIDPRACQIAELSLWLRAQKSYQRMKLKVSERPKITKSNIVCAEPMPGEKEMLEEFISKLKPAVLGDLVREVWSKMQLAGEAGSLLKIEEELTTAIEKAKQEWERYKAGDFEVDPVLFEEMEQPVQGRMRFDVTGVKKKEFWDDAETQVLSALRDFAESATNGHGYQRKLFAEDALQGFAFIDLCRKKFDVVLMNPPFGEASASIVAYLEQRYPNWINNLLCSAISRAVGILNPSGTVGVIFDRSVAIKSSYEKFRLEVLDPRILYVADTGWNVLDANVETTVHVLTGIRQEGYSAFFDIREYDADIKAHQLQNKIGNIGNSQFETGIYFVKAKTFLRLPNAIVGYYFDELLLNFFDRWRNLAENGLQARQGHALVSDEHFRLYWELPNSAEIGMNKMYAPLYNGATFSLFATPNRDMTKFGADGLLVKSNQSVVLRNPDYQFLSGVGYGKRGEIIDAHILCSGSIFTSEGQAITGVRRADALKALSFLNSSLAQFTINQYCGQHKHCGYINLLPLPVLQESLRRQITENAQQIVEIKRQCFAFDETALEFAYISFGLCNSSSNKSLRDALGKLLKRLELATLEIRKRVTDNDSYFKEAARLSNSEAERLDQYISRRPQDYSWPDMERDSTSEGVIVFLTKCLISHFIGLVFGYWDVRVALDQSFAQKLPDPFDPLPACPRGTLVSPDGLPATSGNIVSEEWLRARSDANTLPPKGSVRQPTIADSEYPIKIAWDGILVDDPTNQYDIINHVREVFEVLWKDRADAIEQEACEILGVKSLRDYFKKPSGFFADHLKRYSKSRRQAPIYWPLSTASGSYTLWIYYHRLTDQTLYKCINDFVNPKIEEVTRGVEKLQAEMIKDASAKQREALDEQITFMQELKDFRDELLRVAQLPYKLNLNDGVLITASPFHNLFGLPKWEKDLTECWKKLEDGEYDWAHLAYSIWTDRVREVCKKDCSIAIAHGLEDICEVKPLSGTSRKTDKISKSEKTSKNIRKRAKNGADKTLEKMGLKLD